jgi:hypothetical protein
MLMPHRIDIPVKAEEPPERDWSQKHWWLFYKKCPVCDRSRKPHFMVTLFAFTVIILAITNASVWTYITGVFMCVIIEIAYRHYERKWYLKWVEEKTRKGEPIDAEEC